MKTLDDLTPQHLLALRKADDHRLRGAAFRRDVRDLPRGEGCAVLAEAIERAEIEPHVGSLRVSWFLASPQRMGPAYVERMLVAADVLPRDPKRRVRDLTLPERSRLSAVLRSEKPAAGWASDGIAA